MIFKLKIKSLILLKFFDDPTVWAAIEALFLWIAYKLQQNQTRKTGWKSFRVPERYDCYSDEHVSTFFYLSSLRFILDETAMGRRIGDCLRTKQRNSMLGIASLGEESFCALYELVLCSF